MSETAEEGEEAPKTLDDVYRAEDLSRYKAITREELEERWHDIRQRGALEAEIRHGLRDADGAALFDVLIKQVNYAGLVWRHFKLKPWERGQDKALKDQLGMGRTAAYDKYRFYDRASLFVPFFHDQMLQWVKEKPGIPWPIPTQAQCISKADEIAQAKGIFGSKEGMKRPRSLYINANLDPSLKMLAKPRGSWGFDAGRDSKEGYWTKHSDLHEGHLNGLELWVWKQGFGDAAPPDNKRFTVSGVSGIFNEGWVVKRRDEYYEIITNPVTDFEPYFRFYENEAAARAATEPPPPKKDDDLAGWPKGTAKDEPKEEPDSKAEGESKEAKAEDKPEDKAEGKAEGEALKPEGPKAEVPKTEEPKAEEPTAEEPSPEAEVVKMEPRAQPVSVSTETKTGEAEPDEPEEHREAPADEPQPDSIVEQYKRILLDTDTILAETSVPTDPKRVGKPSWDQVARLKDALQKARNECAKLADAYQSEKQRADSLEQQLGTMRLLTSRLPHGVSPDRLMKLSFRTEAGETQEVDLDTSHA